MGGYQPQPLDQITRVKYPHPFFLILNIVMLNETIFGHNIMLWRMLNHQNIYVVLQKVIVNQIQVFNNENLGTSVKVILKNPIEGITISNNGEAVRGEVSYISFSLSHITKAVCLNKMEISVYRSSINRMFNLKKLSLFLIGAELELERTFVAEVDTYQRGNEEATASCDMFLTEIKDYKCSLLANKMLDAILLDTLTK